MCIRIWGNLLRRLVDLPVRDGAQRNVTEPRSNTSYGAGDRTFRDTVGARATTADGARATTADGAQSTGAPRRGCRRSGTVFSPQRLRVRITQRAWVSLLSETLCQVQSETGGILLGYRDGNDWLVVESIDPGPNSIFEFAYFEYDQPYVNHLANRIVRLYKRPLEVIGLWHRHPGSFDRFSNTDDDTNARYAQLSEWGALSGLVNIDPTPRLTLFHVNGETCVYSPIPFTVLTWEESLTAAPLCKPDALIRTIEQQNKRALTSDAPSVTVTPPEPPLTPTDLERCWRSSLKHFEPASQDPIALSVSWEASTWTDDELARAFDLMKDDMAALSERGIDLELSIDTEGRLVISASDASGRRPLGIIGKMQKPNDEDVFVIHHPTECTTIRLETSIITRALDTPTDVEAVHAPIS